MLRVLGNILCDIKFHVKGKKAGITKLNAALVIITYSGVHIFISGSIHGPHNTLQSVCHQMI